MCKHPFNFKHARKKVPEHAPSGGIKIMLPPQAQICLINKNLLFHVEVYEEGFCVSR